VYVAVPRFGRPMYYLLSTYNAFHTNLTILGVSALLPFSTKMALCICRYRRVASNTGKLGVFV